METLRKYLHFQTSVYQQRTISCQQRRMILEERSEFRPARSAKLTLSLRRKSIECQTKSTASRTGRDQIVLSLSKSIQVRSKTVETFDTNLLRRAILRQLTQIIAFRQREVMSDIYRYIYSIHCNANKEYFITNIKLPQADDKVYQSASSSSLLTTNNDNPSLHSRSRPRSRNSRSGGILRPRSSNHRPVPPTTTAIPHRLPRNRTVQNL